ncbi:hypothetical protein RCH19_002785 [Flavobacterium sp. PL12]
MNSFIFKIIVKLLLTISRITGLTYNEINIIVYYFLIPFSWLWLLDIIFDFNYFKFSFLIFCLGFSFGCNDFNRYSNMLFKKSERFLKYFNRYGSTYIISSVWICILLPIAIYAILITFVLL